MGVQPLAVTAPKNQPCPTLWRQAAIKAWAHSRAAQGLGKVTVHHRGGNRVLALGHRVGTPQSGCESLQEPGSGSPAPCRAAQQFPFLAKPHTLSISAVRLHQELIQPTKSSFPVSGTEQE